VRLDPFNWILIGRLGLELEVGIVKWMSIEAVPIFVLNDTPPLLNYSSYDVNLEQHSGGLGPLAGATLGINFWVTGKPLKGYFIGTGLTNYTLEYESKDASGERFDLVSHTERQLYFLFGSVERFGPFTIGGGIGFGYDVNKETRCFPDSANSPSDAVSDGDCKGIELAAGAVHVERASEVTRRGHRGDISGDALDRIGQRARQPETADRRQDESAKRHHAERLHRATRGFAGGDIDR
jgi:hypothetical protein